MIRLGLLLILLASAAPAETVVAARNIPARSLIGPGDLLLTGAETSGALTDPAAAIGMEARITLYAGRPVRPGDIGPPAIVERNQIVTLVFRRGGLQITAEGRALDRAGPGDVIRVMNLASRSNVMARISEDGGAHVQ